MLDSQTTKCVGPGQEISKSRSMALRRKEHVLSLFGESKLGLRCMIGPVGGSWIRKRAYYCFLVWVISERRDDIIQAIEFGFSNTLSNSNLTLQFTSSKNPLKSPHVESQPCNNKGPKKSIKFSSPLHCKNLKNPIFFCIFFF